MANAATDDDVAARLTDLVQRLRALDLVIGRKTDRVESDRVEIKRLRAMRREILIDAASLHDDGIAWRDLESALGCRRQYLDRLLRTTDS